MAVSKTKGTDRRLKQLKGIKPEKITKEQLDKIQATINNINRTKLEIGTLETRKHEMMHIMISFNEDLTLMQKELEKDYGTFDVDIKDGTINYKE